MMQNRVGLGSKEGGKSKGKLHVSSCAAASMACLFLLVSGVSDIYLRPRGGRGGGSAFRGRNEFTSAYWSPLRKASAPQGKQIDCRFAARLVRLGLGLHEGGVQAITVEDRDLRLVYHICTSRKSKNSESLGYVRINLLTQQDACFSCLLFMLALGEFISCLLPVYSPRSLDATA